MEKYPIVSFTDILVYLIPGTIIISSIIFRNNPKLLEFSRNNLKFGNLFLLMMFAYLIGILTYNLSEYIIYPLYWIFGENHLVNTINRFTEISRLKESLHNKFGIEGGVINIYRYAKTVVIENSPKNAFAADRLMAIADFMRNLAIVIPIAMIIIFRPLKATFRKWTLITVYALLIPFEILIIQTFMGFWSGAIWHYLRSYIIFVSG